MKKHADKKISRVSGLIRSILIGAVTFLLLFVLMVTGVTPDTYDIHVGQPAAKAVYATKDVEDSVTTEALRNAAANAVEPSYRSVDTSVTSVVVSDMEGLFERLGVIREDFSDVEIGEDAVKSINSRLTIELSRDMVSALMNCAQADFETLRDQSIAAVRDTLNSTLPEGQETAAINRIMRNLAGEKHASTMVSIAGEVMRACVQPNMLIDTEITEANRQKARESVEPEVIVKREIIVREGEIVTEAHYQMIASLGLLADDTIDLPLYGGLALLVLAVCVLIALYLLQLDGEVLKDSRQLLLLCIIMVLEVGVSLLVRSMNAYLMPVALGAILLAILIHPRTAVFVGCMLSFLVSMLVSAEGLFSMSMFSVMLMAIAAGPIAALVLSRRQQRMGALLAGLVIGVANFLITLSIGLISSANLRTALTNSLWAIGGAVLSAVLAVGMQAVLEWLFNLATTSKLIELSNPNQPLLRRLLMEASGTYHHSIIVANLAEAGATAVGANGLLARVGAYYHDVGKLKRPLYFKENQMGDNPHDRTDPRVSAAILTAHPRDGAQMAQKERIPAPIVEIIRQHHGDSPVLYFYDKASKLYGEDIDISAFRYEGPRPRSKEAAVVMLADTIEAATRTLANPSPEAMEQMIRSLVSKKMADGQLNDSALTFSDLDKICASFVTVLTGVFHERIEYPDIAIPPRNPAPVEQAGEPVQEAEPEPEAPAEAQAEQPEKDEAGEVSGLAD